MSTPEHENQRQPERGNATAPDRRNATARTWERDDTPSVGTRRPPTGGTRRPERGNATAAAGYRPRRLGGSADAATISRSRWASYWASIHPQSSPGRSPCPNACLQITPPISSIALPACAGGSPWTISAASAAAQFTSCANVSIFMPASYSGIPECGNPYPVEGNLNRADRYR